MTSTIEYERIWYLPTFLRDKDSPKCTLIGHIYQLRRSPAGNINLNNKTNVWSFDNDEAMATFIEKNRAVELPAEADGNPQYIPQRVLNMKKKLAQPPKSER